LDGAAEQLLARCRSKHKLSFACLWHAEFAVLVNVAVGVATDVYRLLPAAHAWRNVLDEYGGAKNGAVQRGSYGAVGAWPLLFEAVFLHAVLVRRDGGAFDSDAMLLDGFCRVNCDFVVGFVALIELEVVVLDGRGRVGGVCL